MKKPIIIVGSIVVALLLMGASFYGGTLYQRNSESSARNRFLASRGIDPNQFNQNNPNGSGGNFQGGTGNGRQGFAFGGGAQGQVKTIDGNTITISTAQNVTTVTLSDSTVFMKSVTGTVADLKVGDRVLVQGQRDSSGNITASEIMLNPAGFGPGGNGNGGPAAAGTQTP
jgi:hypothetical protein